MTPQRETPRMREAYREYLKLGIRRNFDALHQRLEETWVINVPSVSTLKGWSSAFNWTSRVIEDDEIINRRAMDRMRDKMASDIEMRRSRRLQLSDIQLNAVLKAMVIADEKDPAAAKPRDLLMMDPSQLRAVNDTARLAMDTQRLDMGEATTRLAGQEMSRAEGYARLSEDEMLDELVKFIGAAAPQLPAPDGDEEDEEDADAPKPEDFLLSGDMDELA